jgi:polygalacturonase
MFGAYKLTNAQSVEVRGMRGSNIMIQGTADLEWKIHDSPARDVWIHDCVFDKGLAHGAAVDDGNCIQVSQNVESVLIERCILDGAGKDGHAIQFSINAHGRVQDCTIRDFNGRRGRNPAHAVDLARDGSVNDDFERVNRFIDQKRIRLDRNPKKKNTKKG